MFPLPPSRIVEPLVIEIVTWQLVLWLNMVSVPLAPAIELMNCSRPWMVVPNLLLESAFVPTVERTEPALWLSLLGTLRLRLVVTFPVWLPIVF